MNEAEFAAAGVRFPELATRDQSVRYWRQYRIRRRGMWIAGLGLVATYLLSKFVFPAYDLGILCAGFFVFMMTGVWLSFFRHCPRCQNAFKHEHLRGYCENCGAFFHPEEKLKESAQ